MEGGTYAHEDVGVDVLAAVVDDNALVHILTVGLVAASQQSEWGVCRSVAP